MTVEQLISKLQEFPQDAEVVKFYEFGFGGSNEYEPELDYYPYENKVYL
jgi:hypothetical protein